MIIYNQKVQVKWSTTNYERYTSLGYKFTKFRDIVEINVGDLSPTSQTKVRAICDYCGEEYMSSYSVLRAGIEYNGKNACYKCCGLKSSGESRAKHKAKYYDMAMNACNDFGHKLLSTEDELTLKRSKVRYLCPIHGEMSCVLDNLLRGHKCFYCSYGNRLDSIKYTKEKLLKIVAGIDGNVLLNPDDYTTITNRNMRIRCSCGNEYVTSIANYMNHGVTKCKKCSSQESSGEALVRKYLEENGIEYIREKRFADCRDNKPLPFDFFLPANNICIEFDGKQHFEPVFGDVSFKNTRKHDVIKNKYCADNGIELIRIPYYNGHSVNDILAEKINR